MVRLSKSRVLQGTVGSNPTLSVSFQFLARWWRLYVEEENIASTQQLHTVLHSVSQEEVGMRLDVLITRLFPDTSRAEVQRWIDKTTPPAVLVNQTERTCSYKVRLHDKITAVPSLSEPIDAKPQNLPIRIVYEDEHIIIVDKPRGMVVHPAPGTPDSTLVNALLAHTSGLSDGSSPQRPGIVHRLDKDTGGLIMIARNNAAERSLQLQIQNRTASRKYLALAWGMPEWSTAVVEAPIGRHPSDRIKMAVVTNPHLQARHACTELYVKQTYLNTFTLLEAKLQTGRTHQIRVHCAHIHYPIVGDPLYGVPNQLYHLAPAHRAAVDKAIVLLNGQALHAYSLTIQHPVSRETMQFYSQLPPAFENLLTLLDSFQAA